MKKIYAVLDTNVIVSALLKWDSIPNAILQQCFIGTICPIFNDEIISEYIEVLSRPKFKLNEEIISSIIMGIIHNGIRINPSHINITLPDMSDKKFYETVMEAKNQYDSFLITGNIKHFPSSSFIVTPRNMFNTLIDKILQ